LFRALRFRLAPQTDAPELSQRHGQPEPLNAAGSLHFAVVPSPKSALEIFEPAFNGTITNDKFCMSRMGRLQLTWWRLPLRARLPVSNQTGYPTDVNAMECCHQEGTHEETSLEHPASQ
jgi:hypothetical protein